MHELYKLWEAYSRNPSPSIQGAISRSVTKLEGLIQHLPFDPTVNAKAVQEAQDFALACHLYLADQPVQALPAPITPSTVYQAEIPGDAQTTMQAIARDFEIWEAGKEGNCCLHSVLQAINPEINTKEMVQVLRGDVAHEMRQALLFEVDHNWEDAKEYKTHLIGYLEIDHQGSQDLAREKVELYCAEVGADGTYLDDPHLGFLAKILRHFIVVVDPDKVTLDPHGKLVINESMLGHGDPNDPRIYLLHRDDHWLTLVPKNA